VASSTASRVIGIASCASPSDVIGIEALVSASHVIGIDAYLNSGGRRKDDQRTVCGWKPQLTGAGGEPTELGVR